MGVANGRAASIAGLADFLQGRPRALRASEVAALLGVSERLVYKLAADRRIPAFRVGFALRFDPRALANWLSLQMQLAETPSWRETNGAR